MTPTGTDPRRTVCVTGMHRSGTSLAARAIELLGVSLGAADGLLPPGSDNPAGYFENKAIQELDDELLAHLGGAWDQPPVLDPGWEQDAALDPFRERARAVLDRDFGAPADGAATTIGFKDPRVSLLLPFWRTVVPIAATVVLVRDPRAVAASLAVRNDIAPPEAAVLWLRYLLAATANDPGHLLVPHRAFLEDLDATLDLVVAHLGLPAPDDRTRAEIREHIDPGLDHHRPSAPAPTDAAPVPSNPLVAMAEQVWNGGDADLDALGPLLTDAVTRGWVRSPAQGEALARARAEAVSFKEQLKRRNEVVRALKAGAAPPPTLPDTPVVDVDG